MDDTIYKYLWAICQITLFIVPIIEGCGSFPNHLVRILRKPRIALKQATGIGPRSLHSRRISNEIGNSQGRHAVLSRPKEVTRSAGGEIQFSQIESVRSLRKRF